jgi:uncharacterized protein YggT (Ycf19 family)
MRGLTTLVEQFFWTMVWVIVILIAFVFISKWAQNNSVPVLGSVFSWAQQNAGLEQ